jgi:hypothetical protein
MTFGELSASARSIGTYLLDHGHGRGCVAVLMDKHPVQLAAFFGVLYAGGFYVAPDASMPPKRLQMIMDTVQPRMIICDKKNTALAQTLGVPVALYDDICDFPARDALLEAVRRAHIDTDPAYVVFTSGSTGVPKGVAACHRSVIDYTETLCRAVGFDEHTVFGNQTPLYFDAYLKEVIPTMYGADVLANPDYGKIINQKHFHRLLGLMEGEEIVFGGRSDEDALRIEPTVMENVTWEDAVMGEEIFGPILPVLTYSNVREVIDTVRSHEKPLALYLFARDKEVIDTVTTRCQFGGGCINDVIVHLATSEMPFGGVGESGMGSYHGQAGFDTFTHYKSILRQGPVDLPMRYQPYGKLSEKLIRLFLK